MKIILHRLVIIFFCFLSKSVRHIGRSLTNYRFKNYKKIVILRLGGIGDNVILTSVLKPIRETYPNSEIIIITHSTAACVFKNNYLVDKTFSSPLLDASDFYSLFKSLSFKNFISILNLLSNCDLFLFMYSPENLMGFLKLIFLSFLNFKTILVGMDYNGMGGFLDLKIKYEHFKFHEIEYLKKILILIGINIDENIIPSLTQTINDRLYVENILKKYKICDPFITIHATSSPKGWRKEKRIDSKIFFEVINNLVIKYDFNIFLLGSSEDFTYNENLKKNVSREEKIYNLSGLMSIQQLSVLIDKAKLFIGNDSSLAHIAATTSTKVIVLFSFTDYIGYKPFSKNTYIIRNNLPCSPCIYNRRFLKCTNKKCLNISSNEILNIVEMML